MDSRIIYIDMINNIYHELIINNNKIDGFKITGNKVCSLTMDDLTIFKEVLFPNDNMKIDDNYLGYDVYYDKKNNLKHFIKDKEENYLLFLQQNGVLANSYLIYEKKQNNLKDKFKIAIKRGIIIADIIGIITCVNVLSDNIYHHIEPSLIAGYYYLQAAGLDNVSSLEQIRELIYSSNGLNDNQKSTLYNEELFNRVLPYYNDNVMEKLIVKRLKDISIEYYEEKNFPETLGYYALDNIIHIRKGFEKEAIGHEMTHLLQSPLCTSIFFKESSADIIQNEFFGEQTLGYPRQDYNLELLINTIGPEPIWKYVFSGDFSEIDYLLKNNLGKDDYNRIIEIFNASKFSDELDNELSDLISTLYKNIYNEDIKDNPDIFAVN